MDNMERLNDFRSAIDTIDSRIIGLIGKRFEVCSEVAKFKKENEVDLMQNNRVREVKDRCQTLASENGISTSFINSLYSLIIRETCAIERFLMGEDVTSSSEPLLGFLQGSRGIDHVAVAVKNLDSAISFFKSTAGFTLAERRDITGDGSGMNTATMRAGETTFVLAEGVGQSSNVSRFIEEYGPGIQHVAISVENIESVKEELEYRGLELISDVISSPGLKQIFSKRDPNSGIMFEFIERLENSEGFSDSNVQDLFSAMQEKEVY
jgi:methylmalonyl-CoA/ethylmalonyl-CoA epimerase